MGDSLVNITKDKKEIRRVSISDYKFFNDLKDLHKINSDLDTLKKGSTEISTKVKSVVLSKWLELYKGEEENPGTIIFESNVDGDSANIMFVPSDRYIKVTKAGAKKLRKAYDEDIVFEDNNYSLNQKMVDKYGKLISDFIQNSDEIDVDDKDKIIELVKTYSIKKGVIDELSEYGDIDKVFDSVNPVVSMKNLTFIKS
jgi:hypothetical protein